MNKELCRQISKFGEKLAGYGFVHAHFGNISTRTPNKKILITRSGSMLDELDENKLIEVDLDKIGPADKLASSETVVHRYIYLNTTAQAIIHIHSPFAVIESILVKNKQIIPTTYEGKLFLEKIPIIKGKGGSKELALNAAKVLKNFKGAIIAEHGPIAVGKNIEEAYINVCSIEYSCQIKYYTELARNHKVHGPGSPHSFVSKTIRGDKQDP
jgi:L-fuculose-phosphate aldolase